MLFMDPNFSIFPKKYLLAQTKFNRPKKLWAQPPLGSGLLSSLTPKHGCYGPRQHVWTHQLPNQRIQAHLGPSRVQPYDPSPTPRALFFRTLRRLFKIFFTNLSHSQLGSCFYYTFKCAKISHDLPHFRHITTRVRDICSLTIFMLMIFISN